MGSCVRVESYEEGLIHILKFYADKAKKHFLYFTDDKCIVASNKYYDELYQYFYFFNAGKRDRIIPLLEKIKQCEIASSCGLVIPECEILDRQARPKISYPIFITSVNSTADGWKHDLFILKDEDEYLAVRNEIVADRVLVQQYIEKSTEISVQGISINGGQDIYLPYIKQYLRLRENNFGTVMQYNKFDDDVLCRQIKDLMKQFCFSGVFEVEFLLDKYQQLFYLETNFRFSASNQGMTIGGVNLPLEWALATLTGRIHTESIKLIDKSFNVQNEIADYNANVKTGKISLLKYIIDFIRADGHYLWDIHDIKPFVVYFSGSIKRLILKLLNSRV